MFTSVCLALTLFVAVSGFPSRQDPISRSHLSLSSTDDGFVGGFTLEGRRYQIENRVAKDWFRTFIATADGRVLIHASRKDNIVSIVLPTGNIRIDTAKADPFSAEEVQALIAFVDSSEAAIVRRIVYEVRNRRVIEQKPFLIGFRVVAMFLGDGDVMIAESERAIDRSKLTFKMVGYKCPQPPASAGTTNRVCDESNCCGCCGAGCWGCSGCWTEACRNHDECVDEKCYIHPACMVLLQEAIQSIVLVCGSV